MAPLGLFYVPLLLEWGSFQPEAVDFVLEPQSVSHSGHSHTTIPGPVGVISGGTFLPAACTASEHCSCGHLNNQQDSFKGSENLRGCTEGQGQPQRRDSLHEGGCLPCIKLWVESDRSFPRSHVAT